MNLPCDWLIDLLLIAVCLLRGSSLCECVWLLTWSTRRYARSVRQLQRCEVLQVHISETTTGSQGESCRICSPAYLRVCSYSHGVHGNGGSEALTDVLEKVVGGEEVGGARDQILLELQQLVSTAQKHLETHTYTVSMRQNPEHTWSTGNINFITQSSCWKCESLC